MLVGRYDYFIALSKEINFVPKKIDEELINNLLQNVSHYIKQEINYFSDVCPLNGLVAAYSMDYNCTDEIEELLNIISSSSSDTLLNYMGSLFICEQYKGEDVNWEDVNSDIFKMKDFIKNISVEEAEKKNKILYCLNNPDETKQRICFMLKQFYDKAYKTLEKTVFSIIKAGEEKYKELFKIDPHGFTKKYFMEFFKPANNDWPYKIKLHISFFLQIGFWAISIHDYKTKPGWVGLGIRIYDYFLKKDAQEKVENFLKALSDNRRVNIIKMLAEKPYYGYEIAAKLNLTPATVNHHMQFLIAADIISFERENNKVYYTLKKDKVKELFNEMQKMLLHE